MGEGDGEGGFLLHGFTSIIISVFIFYSIYVAIFLSSRAITGKLLGKNDKEAFYYLHFLLYSFCVDFLFLFLLLFFYRTTKIVKREADRGDILIGRLLVKCTFFYYSSVSFSFFI